MAFVLCSLCAVGCASGNDTTVDSGIPPARDTGPHDTGHATLDGGGCRIDADCDDHMACNGMEHCASGACVVGTAVDCNDHVQCTRDTCDDGNGACTHMIQDTMCMTGLVCDPVTGCSTPRACTADGDCNDHVFCNGVERCDMAFGCRRGTVPSCDDSHTCTTDTCDTTTDACVSTPDDTVCADALACNGDEVCRPTDPSANSEGCINGSAPSCDDGIPCTMDVCDETAHGCHSTPSDTLCDDHVFCNGTEHCDLTMRHCVMGTAPTCDDAIGCTIGSCNAAMDRCVQTPSDMTCSDGRACNGAEHCDGTGTTAGTGCVSGAPQDCSDGMACTTDGCAEPGMCTHGGSDADADMHTARGCAGGDDCDDLNPRIHPGAVEICDGIDNDCSGTGIGLSGIDDGTGMQCAFGSAPRACNTACTTAGTQVCDGACHLGVCRAAFETCNNCDDDGDGQIDEPGGGSTVQCRAGDVRSCTTACGTLGTQTCNAGCAFAACVATEVCNSCDDDGNGVVDNGFTLGGACTAGIGACARTGNVVCRSDGTGTTCSATAGAPVTELCNGIDDNCNGMVDEAFTELGVACMSGMGACRRSGVFVCLANGSGTQCSAVPGTAGAETCNGIDDNCNGTIDDGADGGACDGTDADMCLEGTNRCMGGTLHCDDMTGDNAETCNGIDDNCNGTTDEGCACMLNATRPCYGGPAGTQNVGICHGGTQTCVPGPMMMGSMWGGCTGSVTPGTETCNSLDDDCNGVPDNGNPGGGASCDGPDADLCIEGMVNCTGGALVCSDMSGDNVETCNGTDDNCNGTVDEGNPGGGVPCDGADLDSCLEGVTSCVQGGTGILQCSDNTTTNVETCNNMDDNCNGSVDEGNPGGGAACDGADTDLCNEGTFNCASGVLTCSDASGNNAEICGNGMDDDCNPATSDVCSVPGDTCGSPIVLSGAGGSRMDTLVGATAQTSDCGNGVEVFYQITVAAPSIVYLSTLGSTFDTRISYRGTACPGTSVIGTTCIDDSCSTLQTQHAQLVPIGTHYFAVHTYSSFTTPGAFGLTYAVYAAAGGTNTYVTPTPTGGTVMSFSGNTTGGGNRITPGCAFGGNTNAPDNAYFWLQCPTDNRSYSANLCSGTIWDTVMALYLNGTAISCNDDSCALQSAVGPTGATGAGVVQLVVDGYSTNSGAYTASITF